MRKLCSTRIQPSLSLSAIVTMVEISKPPGTWPFATAPARLPYVNRQFAGHVNHKLLSDFGGFSLLPQQASVSGTCRSCQYSQCPQDYFSTPSSGFGELKAITGQGNPAK
jgi:hypothetical protein